MTDSRQHDPESAAIIAHTRLFNLRIAHNDFSEPSDVVRWHGAMQAQDFSGAKWALGLRLPNTTDAAIEDAFNQGRILRTHVLRPTWHFVAPEDIRWMLELTGPRVNAANHSMYQRLGLDDALLQRGNAVFESALAGGKFLARAEMIQRLKDQGIILDNLGYVHLLMHAELEGIICNGPRQGRQFTYALLEERVPSARSYSRAEALAELSLRYFTSHGPATTRDFAWWSGLTLRDSREGIHLAAAELESATIGGTDYWFAKSRPLRNSALDGVHLLPNYDEYIVGFRDRSAYWHESQQRASISRSNPLFSNTIVAGGRIVGTWSRTTKRSTVDVTPNLFTSLDDETSDALSRAVERYAAFLNLHVRRG